MDEVFVGPFGAHVRPGPGSCEAQARCIQPKAKGSMRKAVLHSELLITQKMSRKHSI